MTDGTKELVVLITHGPDEEHSSIGFTIANGGITSGLDVAIFLTSSTVDVVRKKAVDLTQVQLVQDFVKRGGTLWACAPCVKARGYTEEDLIDGAEITGSSPMHERIKAGAATLSF